MLTDRRYVRFLIRVAKATRDRNMKDELDQLTMPTLIIWGRDDLITPPFVAEEFQQGIPNARLVFLDQCGHAPPIEQPRQFARVMRRISGGFRAGTAPRLRGGPPLSPSPSEPAAAPRAARGGPALRDGLPLSRFRGLRSALAE